MRRAVHWPQKSDHPAGDDLALSIKEVIAARYHPRDIVPETFALGEDLVLQEEQSGRSEDKDIPREGKQLHLFPLRLPDLLLLLSLLVVRYLPQGQRRELPLGRGQSSYGWLVAGSSAKETDG